MTQPPDRIADLTAATTELGEQLESVRTALAVTAEAQERRTTVLRRVTVTAVVVACLATAGAVVSLTLLVGAIGDLRDQQNALDVKGTADCSFRREVAKLPEVLLEAAGGVPGAPAPTVSPVLAALASSAAEAYTLGGCGEALGELAPEQIIPSPPPATPTPSPEPTRRRS